MLAKFLSVILCVTVGFPSFLPSKTDLPERSFGDAKSMILIEATTGAVLYEMNADEPLPPASVTKIMTLLLVMEAVDSGKISLADDVTVSQNAASMGGSQIFLEVGECMTVEEMIKAVIIASANDAALALAEHVCGSEAEFVAKMNERASELGMNKTNFENTNGLDDTTTSHLTSARDIAIMSAELIKHETILKYTTVWQDTLRDGNFTLTNTNRLVRFYKGCNGLKTGSTSKAGYCMSASAKRDGLQLIAVVMGAKTRDMRNSIAKSLLDYGFASYAYYEDKTESSGDVAVKRGRCDRVKIGYTPLKTIIEKGNDKKIEVSAVLPDHVSAPIKRGDVVGTIEYKMNGKIIETRDIFALEEVAEITFTDVFVKILKKYLLI